MEFSARNPTGSDSDSFNDRVGSRSAHYAEQVRRSEEKYEAARAYDRARFWFAVRIAFGCICAAATGLGIMGWALHTTNERWASVAWIAGPFVGYALIIGLLNYAANKWESSE